MSRLLYICSLFVCLTLGTLARGAGSLSFSGGNGTPLTLTLNQNITFTINSSSSTEAPLFDFQNLGSILSNPVADSSSTITFTINSGAPISINELATGGGDLYLLNTGFPGITAGETITLHAGSFTTASNYAGAPPSTHNGIYTYVTDFSGNQLSTNGAVTATPEPSTWALILGGVTSLWALQRRRRDA